MGHNLFGKRFRLNDRKPAWHGLGITKEDGTLTAQQALQEIGSYQVHLLPLRADLGPGTGKGKPRYIDTDHAIIVRDPVDDDPIRRIFGTPVSKDYELIGPDDAARIWDEAIGGDSPVETLGALGKGEEMFITTKVKTLNVKGDEVVAYEFLHSPMFSNRAAVTGITAVRIVCANTLAVGLQNATHRFYVPHTPGAQDRLLETLKNLHEQNRETMELLEESFNVLAERKIPSEKVARKMVAEVYADPPEPTPDWDYRYGISYEQHMERYEEKVAAVSTVREAVMSLYEGGGRGMRESVATNGTAFGLYNAVSEFETYRRGPQNKAAVSLVSGDRASKIRTAHQVCLTYNLRSLN